VNSVRVTFVSSHAKLGGAERYLLVLLEALGHEWVEQVICLEEGPFADQLRELRYPTVVIQTGRRPHQVALSALCLRRGLRKRRPDVLHANGIKAAIAAALATAGTGIPLVWVKHDFSGDGLLARFVAARAAAVIVVSTAAAATFRGRARRKVDVVHNAILAPDVDRETDRKLVRDLLAAPAGARTIALVGRIAEDKGQLELVAAMPSILARAPEARFLFVGEDDRTTDYGQQLRDRIDDSGLAGAVTFAGYRGDAVRLISGCDAVVIPSVPNARGFGLEAFGLVGLEAMTVGTPVVAYASGALVEILGDCALLTPPGDRPALADGIVRVLEDDDLRRRLSSCGQARAAANFSFSGFLTAMKERYVEAARGVGYGAEDR
jgi:glycosyltransferase involved in cell wall biosynthesis